MELNYKSFGQGPPLIILHGLFGTLDNWQTLAKRWADKHTVFLVDQRNHGRSPHLPEHNYPAMAEDLRSFMEANWMYEAHIMGHSMGGKTAMQFALTYPDMVDKLIIVDIAPKSYQGGHEEIVDALNELRLPEIEERSQADALLAERIDDYGVRQFLLKNLSRSKEGGYRWKMNLPVLTSDYEAILQNIKGDEVFDGPTLFIRGEKSNYIGADELPLLRSYFSQAELATIKDAGHWVHAEQPAALFNRVDTFLQA
jgi:pimeloyl-ACP methyl ester carboxylesterase